MKAAILIARLLLGLIFFVFGLNGFFNFLEPPAMNQAAMDFMGALAATGYMLPAVKLVETIGGALLLAGIFVPLGLTILAPIIINIALFHVFLDSGMMVLAIVVLALEVFLAWAYAGSFRGVLAAKATPRA